MLKLAGILMLFLSCYMYFKSQYTSEKEKIKQIEDFSELIAYMENRINLYSEPQSTMLSSKQDEIKANFNTDKNIRDFGELLEQTHIFCTEKCKKVLQNFASDFGKGDKKAQLKLCENTLSELAKIKIALSEELKGKIKAKTAIFALFEGILLILLL